MAYVEKPPLLTGNSRTDLQSLRDYLFRMAQSLGEVAQAPTVTEGAVTISYTKDGQQVLKAQGTAQAIQQNAQELRSLIIQTATELKVYTDSKTEEYDQTYVAQSEFGEYKENINTSITTTAEYVVGEYKFQESIKSLQADIDLLQSYTTEIEGEIRRGIVWDPSLNGGNGGWTLGIAISQKLQFTGECGPSDPNNPGDGFTYYYIDTGQTFGLYTSTGWQFWINGDKKGWYDSTDGTNGMLHVAGIIVESSLQIGTRWKFVSDPNSDDLTLKYLGGT